MKTEARLPHRFYAILKNIFLLNYLYQKRSAPRTSVPNSYTTLVINSYSGLLQAKEPWSELFDKTRLRNVFLTWDWMCTWWEVFQTPGMQLNIIVLVDGDEYIGIAPFYINSKVIRFIGTGEEEHEEVYSEYLDLICLPENADLFSLVVCSYLSDHSKLWHVIEIPNVLDDSFLIRKTLPYLENTGYRSTLNFIGLRYYIELPDTWDDYLQMKKSKFRTNIKSRVKKLVSHNDYSMKNLASLNVDQALGLLKELHEKRWRQKKRQVRLTLKSSKNSIPG